MPTRNIEIDLTPSIANNQERIEKELMDGLAWLVVWQEEAKKALVKVIVNGLFNVYREEWAMWAVFLAWPTGVGKTALARAIALTLLGDANAFTKILGENMPHPADIGRLVGAAPGYIGYGDTPALADTRVHAGYRSAKEKWKLHRLIAWYEMQNFSIVLVDEIEKAHRDIPNAFLNAIQSGEMEMASGSSSTTKGSAKSLSHSGVTDFRNTLFIFTSNIGEHAISQSKSRSIGFSSSEEHSAKWDSALFQKEIRKHFAPEFIWRMDEIVRCHALTEAQLREVFELYTTRMNTVLQERAYYSSLRIVTTREYVDQVLTQSKGAEYGARSISGIIKNIGILTGFAINSGKLPKDASGILQFDYQNGKQSMLFLNGPAKERISPSSESISLIPTHENTKILVEWRINKFGEEVRETVQEYLKLIAQYDSGFRDVCRILEERLRDFGFNSEDIHNLQAAAFLEIYQSIEQPASYEIIGRNENMFSPVGFRPIEKYLRSALSQSFQPENIYSTIRTLLKRPMTRDESIVISQHMHRLLQGMRNPK